MKKYLINITVFFFVVTMIDLFVGFVGDYLQANAKGGSTKEFNDLVKNDKHDILVLGSSRARHHYDTPFLSDSLGVDVYNAGYNGHGVILANGILEMTLKFYKPKLLIFDVEPAFDIIVYPEDHERKRYLSELKPYYRIDEIGDIIRAISKEEWLKVHSGMIRYNTVIFKMAIDNIICRHNPVLGYIPLDGVYVDRQENKKGRNLNQIDSVKIEFIERLIRLAQSNEVPIIFVASPKFSASDSSVLNPIKGICEKNNVPIFDYYSMTFFTEHPEWFNDPMHLNKTGARVFSQMIVSDIYSQLVEKSGNWSRTP